MAVWVSNQGQKNKVNPQIGARVMCMYTRFCADGYCQISRAHIVSSSCCELFIALTQFPLPTHLLVIFVTAWCLTFHCSILTPSNCDGATALLIWNMSAMLEERSAVATLTENGVSCFPCKAQILQTREFATVQPPDRQTEDSVFTFISVYFYTNRNLAMNVFESI